MALVKIYKQVNGGGALSTLDIGVTPITGGSVGGVLFEGTGNVLQESANLFWDNTNSRLGIGTATPSAIIHSVGSVTAATAIARGNYLQPTLVATANNDVLVGLDINPTFTNGAFTGVQNVAIQLNSNANIKANGFINSYNINLNTSSTTLNGGGGGINFQIFTGNVGRFFSTGNLVLQNGGTFTDAGYRLDVNGSVRTTGSISAASALARGTYLNQTLVATANNDVLVGLDIQPTFTAGAFTGVSQIPLRIGGSAADQGITFINQNWMIRSSGASVNFNGGLGYDFSTYASTNTPYRFLQGYSTKFMIAATTGNILVNSTTDAGFRLDVNGTARVQGATTILSSLNVSGNIVGGTSYGLAGGFSSMIANYDTGIAAVTANYNGFGITRPFNPTSGVTTYNGFHFAATINQTGGANGITRGLYINPTLTAAADFRAIEVSSGGAYINTTSVAASAILQADSTTKGFLPPRMTTTEKNAIASPAAGLMVYDTTLNLMSVYNGTTWITL